MFNVDFILLIRRMLPLKYRKAAMIAWLSSLLKPLIQLHSAVSIVHPIRFPICLPFPFASFLTLRLHTNLRATISGQKIYLERLLNLYYYNTFNPNALPQVAGHLIYIEDYPRTVPYNFLYLYSENQPLPIYQNTDYATPPPLPDAGSSTVAGPQYIYQITDYYVPHDFIIWVPTSLFFSLTEFRGLVDKYKEASKRYTIKYY